MDKKKFSGFVLRHTVGMWNLLDLNHPEQAYREPLGLSESAAEIWQRLEMGMSLDEIAENLSRVYGIPCEEAKSDVYEFAENLKAFGVPL